MNHFLIDCMAILSIYYCPYHILSLAWKLNSHLYIWWTNQVLLTKLTAKKRQVLWLMRRGLYKRMIPTLTSRDISLNKSSKHKRNGMMVINPSDSRLSSQANNFSTSSSGSNVSYMSKASALSNLLRGMLWSKRLSNSNR
jgi:hypothetical protein